MDTPHDATTTEALPPEIAAACETQPLGRAIRLIGDTWVLLIVINLLSGAKRFGELLEAVGHCSSKTLSHRLKQLEDLKFVERHAFNEIPPRVEYQLTAQGQALGSVIAAIETFARNHLANDPRQAQTD